MMSNLDAGRNTLKAAIRNFSYRENHEEPFTLASGKKSPYYFDLKQTLLNPFYLALAGRLVAQKIAEHYAGPVVAAGLTMGADPIIYAACLAHGCAGVADRTQGGAGVGGAQEVLLADNRAQGATQIFPAIVRKEAKDHGTGKRIEMLKGIPHSTPCVMVDDVITTAGSTLKAAAVMRAAGFTIHHAFCILDRQEGGREALLESGITLFSLFTAAEFKEK